MKKISLTAERDYAKAYYFLKDKGFSESLISSLRKRLGAMTIDGKPITMRDKIEKENKVEICFVDTSSTCVAENDLPLDILFENEDILVVNKPSGVATIPSKSHFADNLAGSVKKYMKKRSEPFVFRAIGRLDKETSGVVVIALNQFAAEKTKVEKTYVALCRGNLQKQNFVIDSPIFTENIDGINTRKRQVSPQGKEAQTFVEVLENKGENTLVKLKLNHGRTHQIRLHFASISHPLCGDRLYGIADNYKRTMLHCFKATIALPDGKIISVTAPLPKDFV